MDTSVDFVGLKLKTPFLIASGQHTGEGAQLGQWVPAMVEHHWAGIVTKAYLKNCDLIMRPYLWTSRELRRVGMQNSGPNLDHWDASAQRALAESVRIAHDAGLIVIGSIMAYSLVEWGEMSKEIEDAGVDAVELNLSCPAAVDSVESKALGGYHAGQNPEATASITRAVADATGLPVLVKLTPNVTDANAIARAAMASGAAGVAAINTVQGILGIDLDTGIPLCSDVHGNAFKSGFSGPMVKPVGLRIVADLAIENPRLPISGIGGISDWRSATEYLMVGATCVQVCTAVMWHGFKLGTQMWRGLTGYMREKGYASVEDFRGKALKHITTRAVACPDAVAVVDETRCNACALCVVPCTETAFGALSIVDGRLVVDRGKCGACGLCGVVCNREAIRVQNVV